MRVLALRRADECVTCHRTLPVGTRAAWDPGPRTVRCLPCADLDAADAVPAVPAPRAATVPAQGSAGASAQREYERRVRQRAQDVRVLHDRRLRRPDGRLSRANIDHLVVAAELARAGADAPVRGALCFVGTDLPWFGERIGDVPLVGRRGLARILRRRGDLGPEDRDVLAQHLAARFPVAH